MIFKVSLNQRIDTNLNMSWAAEVIADNREEAEREGETFIHLVEAFRQGMVGADLESEGPDSK